MPSEQQPTPNSPDSTGQSSRDAVARPRSDGLRMLLGLPFINSGTRSAIPLTAPSSRRPYAQMPPPADRVGPLEDAPVPEKTVIGAETMAANESLQDPARNTAVDSGGPGGSPRAPRTDQLEPMPVIIPGVSTHRTAFPNLLPTADTTAIRVEKGERDAIRQRSPAAAAPARHPGARESTTSDVALFTRLEQLVAEGVEKHSQAEPYSAPPPRGEQAKENGERPGRELAQRFDELQRTVRDLAAAVSSQARSRGDSHFQIKRPEGPAPPTRAFWERSRLGRFSLKIAR